MLENPQSACYYVDNSMEEIMGCLCMLCEGFNIILPGWVIFLGVIMLILSIATWEFPF